MSFLLLALGVPFAGIALFVAKQLKGALNEKGQDNEYLSSRPEYPWNSKEFIESADWKNVDFFGNTIERPLVENKPKQGKISTPRHQGLWAHLDKDD